jgi:hypothetical protein
MKRTTLILDDRRLQELKRLAAERLETMPTIVDQFLTEGIRRGYFKEARYSASGFRHG